MSRFTSRIRRRAVVALAMAVVLCPPRPPKLFAQQAGAAGLVQGTPAVQPQGPSLALTMDDAVRMALEANLGLRSARIDLDRADQGVAGAQAVYLPQLTASFNRTSTLSPPNNFLQGNNDVTVLNLNTNTRIAQSLRFYGGDFAVSWNTGRRTTDELFPTFNPSLNSGLNLSFSQPLWRDLLIDSGRAGIETSVRQRSIADLNVESRMIGMEVQVKNAYLNLVAALESLKVAELNLKTSEDALKAARARVEVGVSPQLEIINQEVNVLTNREGVIQAQQRIQSAEDALRSLILDPARPDYWAVRLEPADQIAVPEKPSINLDQTIAAAMTTRIDLRISKLQLENTDFALRVSKNATLPALDLGLNYSASGNAGTRYSTDPETFVTTVVSQRGFGSALADAFGNSYPTWSIGATFSYPLGRNSAIASYTQQQLARRQQELALQQQQLDVVRQVRDAARSLESSYQRVEVLRARLVSAQAQEEAEQKKYAVGLSSTLDLQNVQNQLTQARTAELNARIDYMRALIAFESVQRIN